MRPPEWWASGAPAAPGRLLAPFGWLYGLAVAARLRWVSGWRAPVPVLCVGNLVLGGAGKTPLVIDLAVRLQRRGLAPHVLSRGHGGRVRGPWRVDPERDTAAQVGDEPLLLACQAPTWVGGDRRTSARAAIAAGARALVMDDGFQNPSLARDLAVVAIDAGFGVGNGRVFPAGPLREPPRAGLGRADAVVLVDGGDGQGEDAVAALVPAGVPILAARLEPTGSAAAVAGRRVVAFAGIGRPAKFFATLRRLDCRIVAAHAFPDHHPFAVDTIAALDAEARRAGALLVTTAKDAARLPAESRQRATVVEVGVVWRDEAAIERLLDRLPDRLPGRGGTA